jgi:two-component system C4-dicarboxylate transport response regulator DctD
VTARPVIVVDDEEDIRLAVQQTLELRGFEAAVFARGDRALAHLGRTWPGAVVSDMRMPRMDGMAFLDAVREIDADLPVILITGHGDVALAVEALRRGAYDFIEKPFAPDRLTETVARAIEKRRLVLENRALRERRAGDDPLEERILGRSPAVAAFRERVRAVAQTGLDVLLTGETGTGKGLAARAIHDLSDRAGRPFVVVNVAALPAASVETELFGHVAAPGARARIGRFEHARGGTLLLDEIGAAPMALQVKLLRVIEERAIEPLGANERVELDLRFIAATKEDLGAMVAAGRFRDDLLYRLNAVTLCAPPLRARIEDAPRLFGHFVDEAARRRGMEPPPVSAETLLAVSTAEWPGNLRQLRNAAECFAAGLAIDAPALGLGQGTLADRLDRYEKSVLAATLASHGGNLKATYEALGLARKTLYEKMQKHGLRREDYAADPEP